MLLAFTRSQDPTRNCFKNYRIIFNNYKPNKNLQNKQHLKKFFFLTLKFKNN